MPTTNLIEIVPDTLLYQKASRKYVDCAAFEDLDCCYSIEEFATTVRTSIELIKQ